MDKLINQFQNLILQKFIKDKMNKKNNNNNRLNNNDIY